MSNIKFYIVDAFTNEAFGGNTAGVVIYEKLNEDIMQKIAAELRYSETAFVRKIAEDKFSIRFFTPNSEVDLCGHASVASFKVLLHKELVKKNKIYYMVTRAGELQVDITEDYIYLEAGTPTASEILSKADIKEKLANSMNISLSEIGNSVYNLDPQIVGAGLYDIILPVKSKEVLYKINPNLKLIEELSIDYGVVGIHAFEINLNKYTASCRNFAPLYGINEEAATGTANAALTYYLYLNNIIKEKNKNYIFNQGEIMNRPSSIITKISDNEAVKIFVGGEAYILASGELFL